MVSAAAGSGKTAVLVERVLQTVLAARPPVEITDILVLTFTRAAASEMRERLAAALRKASVADPTNDRARRQLALLPAASISTIHSLCQRLVRQHFHQLDLDPAFRLLDQEEASLWLADSLDEVLEEAYQSPTPAFTALVESMGDAGGGFDSGLRSAVLALAAQAESRRDPVGWLQGLAGLYLKGETLDETPWAKPLMNFVRRMLVGASIDFAAARDICTDLLGPEHRRALYLSERAELVERLAQEITTWSQWERVQPHLKSAIAERIPTAKEIRTEDWEEGALRRDAAKKRLKPLVDNTLYARSGESLLSEIRDLHPRMEELVRLTLRLIDRHTAEKQLHAVLGFSDLEQLALRLLSSGHDLEGRLVPSSVALDLQRGIAEVLVDECQDLNEVQEAILRLLARPPEHARPNLFMVGDVKQSIYQFRQAEPRLFASAFEGLDPLPPDHESGGRHRLTMSGNFRSSEAVVSAVNDLFARLMSPALGGVAYDDETRLVALASYPECDSPAVSELFIVDREKQPEPEETVARQAEEEDGGGGDPPTAADPEELMEAEREARVIAGRIRRMVGAEGKEPPLRIYDRELGAMRDCRYRDIVILMRSLSRRGAAMLNELRRCGVPVHGKGQSYLDTMEVGQVMALLELLDNPRQDIPLATVLRSPIGGFSENELAEIRLAAPRVPFHEAVLAKADERETELTPDLSARLDAFLIRLERWRGSARREPVSALILRIFRETGFEQWASGLPQGEQRRPNLQGLVQRARQFDEFSRQGLSRFLQFIRDLRSRRQDLEAPSPLPEGADLVRIITIHGSKGLEFPVVFAAGLGRGWDSGYRGPKIHPELGIGLEAYDPTEAARWPSAPSAAVKEAVRARDIGEELRLLYVALTRAREHLVLVGVQRSLEPALVRWCSQAWLEEDARRLNLANASNYLDWVVPVISRLPGGEPLVPEETGRLRIPHWPQASSRWRISLINRLEAAVPCPEVDLPLRELAAAEPLGIEVPEHLASGLQRLHAWRYPAAEAADRFAKWSVSELKRSLDPDSARQPLPVWVRGAEATYPRLGEPAPEGPGSALDRGRLAHRLLQHIDLQAASDLETLRAAAVALEQAGRLPPDSLHRLPLRRIAEFFRSSLGRRILQSPSVSRELMFTLAVPAAVVFPEAAPGDGDLIVQGIIDLIIEEEDGLVLIDYKTDRLDEISAADAAARYGVQMACYARAASEALAKPVKESWLVFLATGEQVPAPPGPDLDWTNLQPDLLPWAAATANRLNPPLPEDPAN